jgi:hypothetical protein
LATEEIAMKDKAMRGSGALIRDALSALHVPGGETLGHLVEQEIEKRNLESFKAILEELAKGAEENVVFEKDDVQPFVQMTLRLLEAVNRGAARRNLRLLAQVIIGLKRNRAFEFDRFQKWATVLESLTRDEILVLGKTLEIMKGPGHVWSLLVDRLVPQTFKTNAQLASVCARLLRTGLLLPNPALGTLTYGPTDDLKELGELAELEASLKD